MSLTPKPILSMEEIKVVFPAGATKDDLAKYYGLNAFDTAIPQQLFDQLAEGAHGDPTDTFAPWGHFVFDYSTFTFGTLFPLTTEGRDRFEKVLLAKFEDPRLKREPIEELSDFKPVVEAKFEAMNDFELMSQLRAGYITTEHPQHPAALYASVRITAAIEYLEKLGYVVQYSLMD